MWTLFVVIVLVCFGVTLRNVQESLLMVLSRPYGVLGIESELAAC